MNAARPGRTVRPVGRRAVLVDLERDDPADLARAVARAAGEGGVAVRDVVPGAATVLVSTDDPGSLERLAELLLTVEVTASGAGSRGLVTIPVVYDGPDLDEVGRRTGLGADQVVRMHTETVLRAAFGGFAPGFCYLAGLPAPLRLPRRDTPRPRVPAGSVAIADTFSAVYPSETPGGWWLLGSTTAQLWDSARQPAALIAPGDRVRFASAPR